MSNPLALPTRPKGPRSAATRAAIEAWCTALRDLAADLDYKPGSRGWCYILEVRGAITKGEFRKAEELMTECRKAGLLPLDFCAEDSAREFINLEQLDDTDPEEEAEKIVGYVETFPDYYTPKSFWEDQDCYVQCLVEKVDLRELFKAICAEFHIPIANGKGWSDLNMRADMMRRFACWEARGKLCVLLYAGDFDPVGLKISDALRSNMEEIERAVGWSPENLIIDRFALNIGFIDEHKLTWIDGLETSSGKDLASPTHPDHYKPHVQEYIRRHGKRKVEANAMLAHAEAARELLRDTIRKYLPADAPEAYELALEPERERVHAMTRRLLRARWGGSRS